MLPLKRLHADLNAFTFSFDPALLAPIRQAFARDLAPFLQQQAWLLSRRGDIKLAVGPEPSDWYIFNYLGNPLLWFSNHSPRTYELFARFYAALPLADSLRYLVDHREAVVLYSGFLTIGNRFGSPSWHQDFVPGAHAYSVITPLFELDADQGPLLYQLLDERVETYRYRLGEAIVFGAGFSHSTAEYGPSRRLRVLLSLSCGSDKFDHWSKAELTIKGNSRYYHLPCGHRIGSCSCRSSWELTRQFSRRYFG